MNTEDMTDEMDMAGMRNNDRGGPVEEADDDESILNWTKENDKFGYSPLIDSDLLLREAQKRNRLPFPVGGLLFEGKPAMNSFNNGEA